MSLTGLGHDIRRWQNMPEYEMKSTKPIRIVRYQVAPFNVPRRIDIAAKSASYLS